VRLIDNLLIPPETCMLLALMSEHKYRLGLYLMVIRPGPAGALPRIMRALPDEYGILMIHLLQHAGIPPAMSTHCHGFVVPPLTGTLVELAGATLEARPGCGHRYEDGCRLRVEDPRQVGSDRVVDAAAVHKLYGGPHALSISVRQPPSMPSPPKATTSVARSRPHRNCRRSALSKRAKLPRSTCAPPCRNRTEHGPLDPVRLIFRLCRSREGMVLASHPSWARI